jgi:hypothetical protein
VAAFDPWESGLEVLGVRHRLSLFGLVGRQTFLPAMSSSKATLAPNMALQRTRRPRIRSGRSLCSLGSPLNARPLGGRSGLVWAIALAFCLPGSGSSIPGSGGSIVSGPADPPHRNFFVIYYDARYLFGARHFGDHRDFGGNTIPAFLVHSKARACWMQISAVATPGGRFGKSHSSDPEEERKLRGISVSWDFTPLAKKEFADLPLRTGGSIGFPDWIEDDEPGERYLLHFNSNLKIPSAETVLVVRKADLEGAFVANRYCPPAAR